VIDAKNPLHAYILGVSVGLFGGLFIGFCLAMVCASSKLSDLHIELIEHGYGTWVVDYKTGNTTFALLTQEQYDAQRKAGGK
jgi:hypothetical protein